MTELPDNNLLAALKPDDLARLTPHLQRTAFEGGARLYEPGDVIEQCYFPCGSAVASFYVVMENGDAVETGMVGCEGALGGIVSHGRLPAFARATVLQGGPFLKIPLGQLEAAKAERSSLERLFNRYADCFVAQLFQTAACNASHSIEQRAARWLGAAIERTGTDTVEMTQDKLGALLGVGRSYVTRVLRDLRDEGLILTRRGAIKVTDVQGLRDTACDCNDLIRAHFDDVLRGVYPD